MSYFKQKLFELLFPEIHEKIMEIRPREPLHNGHEFHSTLNLLYIQRQLKEDGRIPLVMWFRSRREKQLIKLMCKYTKISKEDMKPYLESKKNI